MIEDLPARLRRRIVHEPAGPAADGVRVVVWLRRALRLDDNPALLAGAQLAEALQQPLLLVFCPRAWGPDCNDRRLEAGLRVGRELAREADERGYRLVCALETDPHHPPMEQLVAGTSLFVADAVPVPSVAHRTRWLARRAPVLTLDCACLVPMTLTRRLPERAFRFRQRLAEERQAALADADWPAPASVSPAPAPATAPGWRPLELARLDDEALARLIARSPIDHTIPPSRALPLTRSEARAHWLRWRESGLPRYHRRRNDPLEEEGTSQLSAALRLGTLSVFEIARDLAPRAELGGPAKFLDELLIWRELAWHWCHLQDRAGADLDAPFRLLPGWARATLEQHRRAAPALPGGQVLRGETGEALWDAAQQALLRTGWLHNNLRMTWGKAFLRWQSDPRRALETALRWNNRLALDGDDPASWGGVLWCFGLFDRPFELDPDAPGFGQLRRRSVAVHARRLPPGRYAAQTAPRRPRVALVGAGLAGLAAARGLLAQGCAVTLFDKGRGIGGRLCRRRTPGPALHHGAELRFGDPGSTPPIPVSLRAALDEGVAAGHLERCSPVHWRPSARTTALGGAGSFRPWLASLAASATLRTGQPVAGLRWKEPGWFIERAGEAPAGPFDRVLLTAPAPQSQVLLRSAERPELARLAAVLDAVQYEPRRVLLAVWDQPVPLRPPPGTQLRISADGRGAVLIASAAWSAEQLEASQDDVRRALLALLGPLPAPAWSAGHRWRYAFCSQTLPRPLATAGVVVAGEGLAGSGPPGESGLARAWRSGEAAVGRLLERPLPAAAPAQATLAL